MLNSTAASGSDHIRVVGFAKRLTRYLPAKTKMFSRLSSCHQTESEVPEHE